MTGARPLLLPLLCLAASLLQLASTFSMNPGLPLRSSTLLRFGLAPARARAAGRGISGLRAKEEMQDVLKGLDGRDQGGAEDEESGLAGAKRLWAAAEDGNVDGIRSAIAEGVDVNAQQGDEALKRTGLGSGAKADLGPTALHLASMFGKMEAVKLLLENDASPNIATADGLTPLHMAVINKNAAIAEALVGAGADVEAKNEFDESPRDMAKMMGLDTPSLR